MIACVLCALSLLHGCAVMDGSCLFTGEIYEITPQTRHFTLDDGREIEITGDQVLFPISGDYGKISAPDGIHISADGEPFRTKGGKLAPMEDCGLFVAVENQAM